MKFPRRLTVLLLLGLAGAAPLSAGPSRGWRAGDAQDSVLVQWRMGLGRAALQAEAVRLGLSGPKADPVAALHAQAGAVGLRRTDLLDIDVVRLPPGLAPADIDRVLAGYRASPLVQAAEPDAPARRAAPPNDPVFAAGSQAGLTATAWVQAWNAYPASISFSSAVVVAVLDTGVDGHTDLAGQVLAGASFVDGEGTTDDRNGHGTFVSGLIAALPGNAGGMTGAFINPLFVKILPVKVLGQCGTGSVSGIVSGVLYAVAQGARVLNMSLTTGDESEILRAAVLEADRRGAVVVAAAGNDGGPVRWPAAFGTVISVGALDSADAPTYYSNRGKLDLSAPGGAGNAACPCQADSSAVLCAAEIWSLAAVQPGCTDPLNPACGTSGRLEAGGGTSFAAPLVAAAAAMLLAQEPALTPQQVMQRLVQSAAPTSLGAGFDARAGWGKLDFYRALTLQRADGPGAGLRAYNWPNPFNPERDGATTITFFLPQPQAVELRLIDAGGDLVRRWSLGSQDTWAGMNLLRWDGLNGGGLKAANGGYLLVLESGGQRATHRVAVLR